MNQGDRRCRTCGALASPDAEWCGQCFRPLGEGLAEAPPSAGAAPTDAEAAGSEPTPGASASALTAAEWTCPVCEHLNPLSIAACEVCGTPFARLFAEPERPPEIAPARALAWSLLVPGLGHWMAGRRPDGGTRVILFVWTFGTVLVMLVSRSSETGFGPLAPLFWLFVAASVALYVTSALDAWRIASGQAPLVSTRVLLWAVVGLVVVSAVMATFLTMGVARGG